METTLEAAIVDEIADRVSPTVSGRLREKVKERQATVVAETDHIRLAKVASLADFLHVELCHRALIFAGDVTRADLVRVHRFLGDPVEAANARDNLTQYRDFVMSLPVPEDSRDRIYRDNALTVMTETVAILELLSQRQVGRGIDIEDGAAAARHAAVAICASMVFGPVDGGDQSRGIVETTLTLFNAILLSPVAAGAF